MTIQECIDVAKLDEFYELNHRDTIKMVVQRIVKDWEEQKIAIEGLM